MSTRLINGEAATLSDGLDALWRDVRKATTGHFTTRASLETADRALAALLNSRDTDLKRLRDLIQGELGELQAGEPGKAAA